MAEAIVSIVVGRLGDFLIEDAQLLHEVRDEIQQMASDLMRMKTFLQNAANSNMSRYNISIFDADLRELAYEVEHVVETFVLKASSTKKTIQWMNRVKFSKKIKDLEKKMSLLSKNFSDFNIGSASESPKSSNYSYGTPGMLERHHTYNVVEPDLFVGFQGDVDCLVKHLVDESDDCYPLIAICGMGGLGKTTLAEKIYNHSSIKSHFASLAWVGVKQKWQAKEVLNQILLCLVPERENEIGAMDNDMLVKNLQEIQQRKKCLIVLDDIRSTNAWNYLKDAFAAEKSVSKVLLTSRNVDVVEQVNPRGLIHRPEFLSEEQSWELLKLRAFPRGGDCLDITRDVKKMEEMGREMVRNCGGLPLAIVMLGGILVTKPSLIEWKKVYDDSLLSLKKGKGLGENYQSQLFGVLLWSYNNLPPQLKPCFLYLGKFSGDEWIETESLYQLWIAEGMVLSSDKRKGESMMQVAESYMEEQELVHKSMVQVRLNTVESALTKFESVSLHDVMRELTLFQAKEEGLFEVIDLREGNDSFFEIKSAKTQQLAVYYDEGSSKASDTYFVKKAKQQRYRSLLLFNEYKTSLPPVLGSHFANFRFLRVFSLEKVWLDRQTVLSTLFRVNLGRVLGSLVYLRYLSVRRTNLLVFPSIQKLVLLETLDLNVDNDIYYPAWLPTNILGKFRHLRHVYLPYWEVHGLGKNFKLLFDGLTMLETLENFDPSWCEVKDLPKLTSVRKLSIQVNKSYYDVEEMMKYVATLASSSSSCLQYLALSIAGCDLESRNGPNIVRQLLWDHSLNLRELTIFGSLPELAQLFEQQQLHNTLDVSLIHINSLTLSLTLLEETPMPLLERIPTLSELILHQGSYLGKEIICSAMGFPKLTNLVLRYLPNLVKWTVEEGSMPNLSDLMICECAKLEELPEGLIFLNSLQRLHIKKMPSHFCNRLRMVNGVQGADLYKVSHVPSLIIYSD